MNSNNLSYLKSEFIIGSEQKKYVSASIKGKCWYQICLEEEAKEEAEEEAKALIIKESLKILNDSRKQLLLTGDYELEDGEIIE
jgi:hypothetical protein